MNNKIRVKSPGRINIIGEHTDYNLGFVLPAAIDKTMHFEIEPSDSNKIELHALDLGESIQLSPNEYSKSELTWANYLIGILNQINRSGLKVDPFKCSFGGDIPLGAGLSSSAALSCGFAFSLNEYFDLGLKRIDMARMARKSESELVGVNCGIMDQYACLFGEENALILIDCRSEDHQVVKGDFSGYNLVLCDTNVKHSLASSAYNTRREECEEGVKAMNMANTKIESLRDATLVDLQIIKDQVSSDVFDRCEYVIKENERVGQSVEALKKGDLIKLGSLMFDSHEGLSKKYKVSCDELDVLADLASQDSNVLGSRMMGGGFGGCTINLIKSEGVESFKSTINKHYTLKTGKEVTFIDVNIVNGVERIS